MSSNVRAVSLPKSQNYVGAEHGALFRFAELERPGRFFPTAIGPGWLHSASGTQLLLGLRSRTVSGKLPT